MRRVSSVESGRDDPAGTSFPFTSTNGGLPGEKNRSLIFAEVFSIVAKSSGVEIGAGAGAAAAAAATAGRATGAIAGAAAVAVAVLAAGTEPGATAGRTAGAAGRAAAVGAAGTEAVGATLGGRLAGFVGEDIKRRSLASRMLQHVSQDQPRIQPEFGYGGHAENVTVVSLRKLDSLQFGFSYDCHPERSRFSGVAKDLPLSRPIA